MADNHGNTPAAWTAVGVAMLGFWALAAAGQIDPTRTLYSASRWLWGFCSMSADFWEWSIALVRSSSLAGSPLM